MLEARATTERFTVKSENTVSGLTINIHFHLSSSSNPHTSDSELLKPSAIIFTRSQLSRQPTIPAYTHHTSVKEQPIISTIEDAFLRPSPQRRQARSQRNRLRLAGRGGEHRPDRRLPALWALEPEGAGTRGGTGAVPFEILIEGETPGPLVGKLEGLIDG